MTSNPLVQIKKNITDMFFIMASLTTKIAQKASLLNKMVARAKNRNILMTTALRVGTTGPLTKLFLKCSYQYHTKGKLN